MKVLILRDRRPGHFNQSEGVVRALQRFVPVEAARVDVAVPALLRGRTLRSALRAMSFVPGPALRLFHGIRLAGLDRPDLIVSAGGDTLAANRLLARLFSASNLFIGSLREAEETAFTAVLTIYPSVAVRPRHILTLKPPPFDPDGFAPPRPIGSIDDLQGATASLFVGGPSGSHDWSQADWQALATLITALSDRFGIAWTITNSRRTPEDASERLRALAAAHPKVSGFVDFRQAGSGSAVDLFGADVVAVTGDSATMLMEGVAARRPVVALSPDRRRSSRDDEAIDALEREKRLARLSLAVATPEAFADAVIAIEPLAENPLDALARKLKQPLGL